ncbi:uncharacterized protein LOC132697807 isoform X2 [Cylas formicarius]|uniref:uncharacterized protein LOC132697807 isoform X2 n=1 Tax=Cylas formicarius TaxID=197179 RepID=UPI00295876B1|nr:uncharacterized protein LOC132697807 isoform X2 [Cylas formicarius]
MVFKCKECGCTCKRCLSSDHDVQLHVEIENLKQKLLEKENHIVMMETNFLNEANKFPNGEFVALKEELLTWQDKYERLYEAHRRVQRVNQGLEDKLLKLVDVCETEKNTLTKDVATLSQNLAEANYAIKKLTQDNERYKNDVSLAIQFLQCKQTNFVAHRFDTLPLEVQTQVAAYMNNKRKPAEEKKPLSEPKSIKVPIPTFPPTAMVYSVPKSPGTDRKPEVDPDTPEVDIVSASIMAKVLEERQKERALAKHCDTCTCAKTLKIIYEASHQHVGTQTGRYKENLCLKCNDVVVVPVALGIQPAKLAVDSLRRPSPLQLDAGPNVHNVVKVQPNNFLREKAKSDLKLSSGNVDIVANSASRVESADPISIHHRLCDKSSQSFELVVEKGDSEQNVDRSSAKNTSSDNPKGPRYCSMRLQSGSKNILLDNAHSNVAPVLYTRSHKARLPAPQATHKPVDGVKSRDADSASSRDSKANSLTSDNSAQHQQRVADWVRSSIERDNATSSPDACSRAGDAKPDAADKTNRAREGEKGGAQLSQDGSRTSSHTETDI